MKTIFLGCLLLAQAVVIPLKRDMTSGAENYNNVSFLKTKFTVFLFVLQNIRKSMEVCYMLKNEEECLKNLFSDLYFWS